MSRATQKQKESIKSRSALTKLLDNRALAKLSLIFFEICSHTLAMVLSLLSIWLIHSVLVRLLGADVKFFDTIPIRWLTDVGDIVIISKFLFEIVKGFKRPEVESA
ncbi:MAG: hypothetical protein DMF61_23715 [Blastocatellia bacterium AA13]|nr:MAG: hypothetical protein DMF61_23715 [Blastocatellia bacterium AA13]